MGERPPRTPGEAREDPPPAEPAGRSRIGGRSVKLRRGRGTGPPDDPEKARARSRIRACKLCATSTYLCLAGAVVGMFLCGALGWAVCGMIAAICGGVGLLQLRSVGPPDPAAADEPGLVRLSARMAENAPTKAWVGVGVGGCMSLGGVGLMILRALAAA